MNTMCDGGYTCESSEGGEVRLLPLNGDANLIVCFRCYLNEMIWRRQGNRQLGPDARWELPRWSDLKLYRPQ